MRRTGTVPLAATLLLLMVPLSGCVSLRGFHLMVNGFSGPESPLKIGTENSVYIIENADADNTMFEKEVVRTARRILEEKGIRQAPYEEADYLVVLSYGNDGKTEVAGGRVEPVFDLLLFPRLRIGFRGFTFVPTRQGAFLHWLEVKAVESRAYRDEQREEVVWLGQVSCTSTHNDMREVIRPMLIGALDTFGVDTGRAVEMIIEEHDERLETIASPSAPGDRGE